TKREETLGSLLMTNCLSRTTLPLSLGPAALRYSTSQNQAVPNPVCHPAAGANLGEFPPSLLQRPPNGPAGLRGETTTNDPERGGASGVQPTEDGTRHPATH